MNSSSLIATLDKPISIPFPNNKNALHEVTNYNQEQPIDFNPKSVSKKTRNRVALILICI
jgi:hypothetical protein